MDFEPQIVSTVGPMLRLVEFIDFHRMPFAWSAGSILKILHRLAAVTLGFNAETVAAAMRQREVHSSDEGRLFFVSASNRSQQEALGVFLRSRGSDNRLRSGDRAYR
jgi:hypothetical protein